MKQPYETGIVHLWDLPEDIILIGLKKEFKISMLKAIKKSSKKIIYFLNEINEELHTYYNFKHNQKVKLSFLWKVSNKLLKKGFKEFNKKNIEKNIEFIGTKRGQTYIFSPKLPFNFNTEAGAYFISAIIFDGGIDKQFKPHYGNIVLSMRKRIVESAKEIFGELKNREINLTRNDYFIRFPKSIGIVLTHCFKIKEGNKVYSNNSLPQFIFKYNNKLKSTFLKQAFDDDGSVDTNKKTINITGTTDVKKEQFYSDNSKDYNLINDIKTLLLALKIESNQIRIRKRSYLPKEYNKKGDFFRHSLGISITGKKNLELFYHKIGFNLEYKKERLRKAIKSYKQDQLRKGEIKKIALEKASILQKEKGYFDNITLTKEIKRQYRQTVRITKQLLKEGKIKIKEKAIPIGNGWIPIKFVLNEKY
ncbi:hypothetical protein CL618_02120 [archaeon]|nr:hypothetical protein [archaeon]|tara:strand:+ start:1135 stop:2394 length:1260 start_codon:yes stop_codon:yes gene_type:complete